EGLRSWRIPFRGPRDKYLPALRLWLLGLRLRAGRETKMRGLVFSSPIPLDFFLYGDLYSRKWALARRSRVTYCCRVCYVICESLHRTRWLML
ncbi:hypothetical protein BD310DRAFT_986793, partial [Dichomitus squalens]